MSAEQAEATAAEPQVAAAPVADPAADAGLPRHAPKDDPRICARQLAALAVLGLDNAAPAPPVNGSLPLEDLLAFGAAAEAGFGAVIGAFLTGVDPIAGVSSHTEVIKGVDDNDITLYIHKPTGAATSPGEPLPAIVHYHGGAMTILSATDANYARFRDALAATGFVVVGVEFRNGGGRLGPHPFPAGLNDCASAAQWAITHKEALGVSKIILSGESGGGNLALATALKAKQEGWVGGIAGVYSSCPYISGAYSDEPPAELPSLRENNGFFFEMNTMSAMARLYNPDGTHDRNPLAWPYYASADDLAGLPPHTVSVNELDPLYSEGVAYYRKLTRAGVCAYVTDVSISGGAVGRSQSGSSEFVFWVITSDSRHSSGIISCKRAKRC
jgi:acetyl esterase